MALRNIGVQRGRVGKRSSRIPASSGVRPPLRKLHETQEQTTFSQEVEPPRDRGMTWSRFRSARRNFRPQYWQIDSSRA